MVAMTSAESTTPSPSGRELGSSSASGALLPPLTEALPVPMDTVPEDVPLRPVLSAWSPVAALRDRFKTVNGPTYGTKDELWKRLCEYEARAEQQLRERQWIEARKNELIQGAKPHEGEILDGPSKPEDPMDIERHDVTHIPPMPWCLACRLGKGRDASHFRSPAVREAAQIEIDSCFLHDDAAAYDVAEPVPETWATILCAVDVETQTPWQLRLVSSSVSSKDSGTLNWSSGATVNLPFLQLWTGLWRKSRRQVCRHEFDQRKHLVTVHSPWVQWGACNHFAETSANSQN